MVEKKRISLIKDESAQVGVIIVLVLGLVVFAIVYIILGEMIDIGIEFNNDMIADFPMSAERETALGRFSIVWSAAPIIVLFGAIFWGIRQAIRSRSGEVR